MDLDRHGKLLSKDHDNGPTLHQGLRLGSYPYQKFRVTPRKYSGVTMRTYDTKNGVIYKYEPWVRFKKDKFYFQGQTTAERELLEFMMLPSFGSRSRDKTLTNLVKKTTIISILFKSFIHNNQTMKSRGWFWSTHNHS